jgi:hypothetical protein
MSNILKKGSVVVVTKNGELCGCGGSAVGYIGYVYEQERSSVCWVRTKLWHKECYGYSPPTYSNWAVCKQCCEVIDHLDGMDFLDYMFVFDADAINDKIQD